MFRDPLDSERVISELAKGSGSTLHSSSTKELTASCFCWTFILPHGNNLMASLLCEVPWRAVHPTHSLRY